MSISNCKKTRAEWQNVTNVNKKKKEERSFPKQFPILSRLWWRGATVLISIQLRNFLIKALSYRQGGGGNLNWLISSHVSGSQHMTEIRNIFGYNINEQYCVVIMRTDDWLLVHLMQKNYIQHQVFLVGGYCTEITVH